jgi:hypothetical protein
MHICILIKSKPKMKLDIFFKQNVIDEINCFFFLQMKLEMVPSGHALAT